MRRIYEEYVLTLESIYTFMQFLRTIIVFLRKLINFFFNIFGQFLRQVLRTFMQCLRIPSNSASIKKIYE